jgi:hypothetical protein
MHVATEVHESPLICFLKSSTPPRLEPVPCVPGCYINTKIDVQVQTAQQAQVQNAQQWQAAEVALVTSATLPVDVRAMVRHERDPYLYFLDISNGLKDFGLKRTEKVGRLCLVAPM